jgi:hypothetical protein
MRKMNLWRIPFDCLLDWIGLGLRHVHREDAAGVDGLESTIRTSTFVYSFDIR